MKECSCYHIVVDEAKIQKFIGNEESTVNFHSYSQFIFKGLTESGKLQDHQFDNDSKIKQEYLNYLKDQTKATWNTFHELLANSLLSHQTESQRKANNLKKKITTGSLLAIHNKNEDSDTLVLINIEHNKVADTKFFEEMLALPLEKPALKAAIISYNKDQIFSIGVSNAPFARYWDKLLQTTPVRENKVNTLNAIEKVEHLLKTSVRKNYKADYIDLRNGMLIYFRNNEGNNINYDDFVGTVFDQHIPRDKNFKKDILVEKLLQLPDNNKTPFDRQFMVDMKDCNKNLLKTSIALSNDIDLTLKKGIDDLEDSIEAYENDGRKGIIIYSEEGHRYFKEKD